MSVPVQILNVKAKRIYRDFNLYRTNLKTNIFYFSYDA